MSGYRGIMIGGKDRQAPVDESIMPTPQQWTVIPSTAWQHVGLTWADIIAAEAETPPEVQTLLK